MIILMFDNGKVEFVKMQSITGSNNLKNGVFPKKLFINPILWQRQSKKQMQIKVP